MAYQTLINPQVNLKKTDKDKLLKELLEESRDLESSPPPLDIEDVVKCLLSLPVSTKDPTAKRKVINGTFMNSLNDRSSTFVPIVSIMQLYHYSHGKTKTPLGRALFDFIEQDTLASLTGTPFETFHAHWERVIYECYRHEKIQQIPLNEYYLKG